jgi:hypothetical protein
MSGGNNHYSGCTCPWCYHPSFATGDDAKPINFEFATRDSYTIPNARCPECDDPVFFYRSPYGGSVYFDKLGVPWPKHPCMDKGRPPRRHRPDAEQDVEPRRQVPKWEREGWLPIAIHVIGNPDSKGVQGLFVREILSGLSHYWDTSNMPNEVKEGPAFARRTSGGEWEIDTPSGSFIATEHRIDPNSPWRQRLRAFGKGGTPSK